MTTDPISSSFICGTRPLRILLDCNINTSQNFKQEILPEFSSLLFPLITTGLVIKMQTEQVLKKKKGSLYKLTSELLTCLWTSLILSKTGRSTSLQLLTRDANYSLMKQQCFLPFRTENLKYQDKLALESNTNSWSIEISGNSSTELD